MATHDYSIANQSFPATRADINNALTAIKSSNSGAAAPTTSLVAGQLFYDTSNSKLQLYNGSSFVDVSIGGGSVGLDSTDYISWTNNTRTDFYVNGANKFRMELDGDFHADGDVVAYSTTISDERLKTGISTVSNALEKVSQLNGVEFTRKNNGQRSAGVIAQEVEKVLPQAIREKKLPLQTLKTGITTVTDALTKVSQLNGVEFTRKNNGQRSAGVIAQEVEKVLPQAIREKKLPLQTGEEDTLYKTVEYDALHSLYIEAIKELKGMVESQALEIKELQKG